MREAESVRVAALVEAWHERNGPEILPHKWSVALSVAYLIEHYNDPEETHERTLERARQLLQETE